MTSGTTASDDRITALAQLLGRTPDGWVRAPGRVNLIGDHTDYQLGWCLPVAIDRDVVAAWSRRSDRLLIAQSAEFDAAVRIDLDRLPDLVDVEPWARQVVATVLALAELDITVAGVDIATMSSVPLGSGLSSSEAFGVAIARTLADAAAVDLSGNRLAIAAQRAEHIVGVPCGLLDQMASVHARRDHALLLDCRDLATTQIPLPASLAVVVIHSGLPRTLATSAYAQRRDACERAAARLGITSLRDARPDDVVDDPFARHVVSENARVLAFAEALRSGRVESLGPLMAASHASLAHDFDVSTPEVDLLVETLVDVGAIGARMTGGGFGGCVVALADAELAPHICTNAVERYRDRTGLAPFGFVTAAADGAGPFAPEPPEMP